MSIWQFRLDLVPITALRAKLGVVPISISKELAEGFAWWADVQPRAGLEESIDAILPRANSWSEEMLIWGDERGDTASICYDSNQKIEWIGFRVDVRVLSLAIVKSICGLAKELECVLLTGSYHLIAPEDELVLDAINHSTAKSYLDDPVSTLLSLRGVFRFPEEIDENDVPPNDSE